MSQLGNSDTDAPTAAGAAGRPVLGGAFIASQVLALNVVGFFSTAYIIRRLGPLQFGQWATAAALASAHLLMTNAGLRTMFVRDVARRPDCAPELLASQLAVRLALGGAAALSTLAMSILLHYPPVVVACAAVGCVWILISVIASTFGDLLQSLERFASYSATAFASGAAVTASSLLAVFLGCGPIGLSIAYLVAPAVSAFLCWRTVRRHVGVRVQWDTARVWSLLREARLVGFNQLAASARDRAEALLVPRLAGLEAFGMFSAGVMFGDRLANVPDAVCTAFYPRIARAAHASIGLPLEQTVARMLSVGLAASLPFAIVSTYLADSLSAVLLPDARETCRVIIQISVWSVPLLAVSLGMSFALQAAGHHECVARAGLRTTAAGIAVSSVLIAGFGIYGASCAVVARPVAAMLGLCSPFRRRFPRVVGAVPLARIFVATAVLSAVCLVGERDSLWTALPFAAAGVAAYAATLFVSGVFSIAALMRLFTPAGPNVPVHVEP